MEIGRVTFVLLLAGVAGIGLVAGVVMAWWGRGRQVASTRADAAEAKNDLSSLQRRFERQTVELERLAANRQQARTAAAQARQAAHDLQVREAALTRQLHALRSELGRIENERAQLLQEAERNRSRFDDIIGLEAEATSLRVLAQRVPDLQARVRELERDLPGGLPTSAE